MTRLVGIVLAVIVLAAMTVRLGLVLAGLIGMSVWWSVALLPVLLLVTVLVRVFVWPEDR